MQKKACRLWPSRPVERAFFDPVRSSVPALLIGGDLDPVNPPRNVEWLAQTLSRARRVIVPRGSHDFDGMEGAACIDRIITQFIETGSEKNLDTRCIAEMRPVPFALR